SDVVLGGGAALVLPVLESLHGARAELPTPAVADAGVVVGGQQLDAEVLERQVQPFLLRRAQGAQAPLHVAQAVRVQAGVLGEVEQGGLRERRGGSRQICGDQGNVDGHAPVSPITAEVARDLRLPVVSPPPDPPAAGPGPVRTAAPPGGSGRRRSGGGPEGPGSARQARSLVTRP